MKGKKNALSKKPARKSIGVMNVVLIIVGIALVTFTIAMIHLFTLFGSVPDTLVTCVFACLGGECGIMGWIKTTKERNKDREWELEDRAEEKAEQMAAMTPAEEPEDGTT
ncbi:hypothetical protein EI53_01238 [Fusobacterium naviforme]|nr:hypothetical protein F7P78_06185 [Fusobacterium naviforme]PSL10176.1 hypothetical protein EI53_01238 [Fusobacterium naviforme]STO27586.1 Uncharacterised protein [Fusobacterium naviforme]